MMDEEILKGHDITVSPSGMKDRPFKIAYECGNLLLYETATELGVIIRIHWSVIRQQWFTERFDTLFKSENLIEAETNDDRFINHH